MDLDGEEDHVYLAKQKRYLLTVDEINETETELCSAIASMRVSRKSRDRLIEIARRRFRSERALAMVMETVR